MISAPEHAPGAVFSLPGKRLLHVAVLYLVGDLAEGLAGLHVELAALGQVPRETIPTTLPPPARGRRRTCLAAMSRVASLASSSGDTTAQLRVMMSFTWVLRGSSSAATQRRMMSRSVTMPRRPPSLTADGQGAHVVPGQEPGRQGGRLAGGDGDHAGVHKIAYLHDKTAFLPNFTASLDGKGGFIPSFSPRLRRRGPGPRQAKARSPYLSRNVRLVSPSRSEFSRASTRDVENSGSGERAGAAL